MSTHLSAQVMHLAGSCPMNQSETPTGTSAGEGSVPVGQGELS